MKHFNPVVWAIAVVILLLFGAASYRVFDRCETSSLKLRDWLEVTLGGNCPKAPGPSPAEEAKTPAESTRLPGLQKAGDARPVTKNETKSTIPKQADAQRSILPLKTIVPLTALARNTGDDVGVERIADPGRHKAGDLSYGPYWPMQKFGGPGKYIAEYEVFVDQSTGSGPTVGRLLLSVNTRDLKQGILLAEQQLSPADWKQTGYKTITLGFDVPEDYANWLMQTSMQWDGKYLTKLRPIKVLRVQ